jgi:hypothetical protein
MTIQFWSNDPTILFNKDYIFELWPTASMCYEQKLNAISRLIILLTILGYILTMSKRVLAVGALTLLVIFILYNMRKQKITKEMLENFEVQGNEVTGMFDNKPKSFINPVTLDAVLRTEFKEGNKKNPFSNVLLTQINDEPERKAAPPSFNIDVDEDITKNVKRSVQMMNPGIKNTNKQLFGDLYEQFLLDQSNRAFFSTPNTRVTPDTGAYAQYLYNDMKYSGKLSTPEGAIARVQDNYRYTLY